MNLRRRFTLIELMIVIAIIAVIASIALPNLVESKRRAREAGAIGFLKTLQVAQTQCREKQGIYAGTSATAQFPWQAGDNVGHLSLKTLGLMNFDLSPPFAYGGQQAAYVYGCEYIFLVNAGAVLTSSAGPFQINGSDYYVYLPSPAPPDAEWFAVALPPESRPENAPFPMKTFYTDTRGTITYTPQHFFAMGNPIIIAAGPRNATVGD